MEDYVSNLMSVQEDEVEETPAEEVAPVEEEVPADPNEKIVDDVDINELRREFEELKAQREREKQGILAELTNERNRRRQSEEQYNKLHSLATQFIPQEEEQTIDPTEDPVGYLEAIQKRELNSISEKVQSLENALLMERQQAALEKAVQDTAAWKNEHPDFDGRLQFFRERAVNLSLANGIKDPEEIKQRIEMGERQLMMLARQHGRNPGELLTYITDQIGFKPAEATPAATPTTQTVDKINKSNKSLSRAGGSAGGPDKITQEDFHKLTTEQQLTIMSNESLARKLEVNGHISRSEVDWEAGKNPLFSI